MSSLNSMSTCLISSLLERNPETRKSCWDQLKENDYFDKINFDNLQYEDPPIRPGKDSKLIISAFLVTESIIRINLG
jgi:hypothetical protein